jgi:hypothetical protein
MSQLEPRSDKFNEALRRLMELDAEAVERKMSCRVVIELTYQKGVAQHVQDERRRYERP